MLLLALCCNVLAFHFTFSVLFRHCPLINADFKLQSSFSVLELFKKRKKKKNPKTFMSFPDSLNERKELYTKY